MALFPLDDPTIQHLCLGTFFNFLCITTPTNQKNFCSESWLQLHDSYPFILILYKLSTWPNICWNIDYTLKIIFDMIVWESEPRIDFLDKIEIAASMLSGLTGWKSNTIAWKAPHMFSLMHLYKTPYKVISQQKRIMKKPLDEWEKKVWWEPWNVVNSI